MMTRRFAALLVGLRVAGIVGFGIVGFGVVGSGPSTAAAADFTLRLNHTLPTTHLRQHDAELFKQMVAKATNNRVDVQIFPAGQLYKSDTDAIKAVRGGAIEGAMVTTGDLALFVPAFNLYETPFLISNYKQLDAVLDSPVSAQILAKLEPIGVKGLVHTNAGSAIVLHRQRPIHTADDMQGMRLRASAGQMQIKAFAALQASAIQLPFGDIAPSLERGVIDGVLSTPSAFAATKLGGMVKYGTWTQQQLFPPVIIVNLAWWNKLPPDLQNAINGILKDYERQTRQMNADEEAKALEDLRAQGVSIVQLDAAGVASFKAKLAPLYADAKRLIGESLYDEAVKVIDATN